MSSRLTTLKTYWSLCKQRAREGHLSVSRQVMEMLALAILTGNGPGFYQMAGLWRKSIPWSEKRDHLGISQYARKLAVLNPEAYRKISQHKLSEKGILKLLGFPTPEFLGYLHAQKGRTLSGAPLRNSVDVLRLLAEQGCSRACFKLVEGWAGQGFEVMDVIEEDGKHVFQRLSDGKIEDPDQFCTTRTEGVYGQGGTVIERYLEQHSELRRFNATSVNTYRIWVLESEAGSARCVLAFLRIGRAGSLVDNTGSGGMLAPIDMETGMLGVAIDGQPERREFAAHPDHGAQIGGITVPYWSESKALAEACLNAFPHMRFAGLDMAVGQDGPVIIEMNAFPDREGAAKVGVANGRIFRS